MAQSDAAATKSRKSRPPAEPTVSEGSLKRLKALARDRVVIEGVAPLIDGGRFAVKRTENEPLAVEADIFSDGHEIIAAALLTAGAGEEDWRETPFTYLANDRWTASVAFARPGPYRYTIVAWRDTFATWASDTKKKRDAGVEIALELREGATLLEKAADSGRGTKDQGKALKALRARVEKLAAKRDADALYAAFAEAETAELMRDVGLRENLSRYETEVPVWVDREAAGFSSWYELMPRSQSGDVTRHGTFDDVIARLPDIQEMGFDVLYFPPIHPIGQSNRKGRNNSVTAQPGEPGSPYAIGSAEGGHKDLHPELGSFADFQRLVTRAADHGLEIAIDFAIQCSPDHPWIKEHPGWFDWRPDGTIKYAENPPKKYQDIVNVDFYAGDAVPSLWIELRDVVLFWLAKGVRIFRVDNPHTKPFPFWEWMIAEVRAVDPGAIFLAEAFTRPKLMKRLAKVGYNQSYSYFTWRNAKWELRQYLEELTKEECGEFMRPNFFVNTPDINPLFLHTSGRAGFRLRLALAATLAGNYGVYSGFELCESEPLVVGKEEYKDSEKYEVRAFDWKREGNIRDDIAFFNRIRRSEPALRDFRNLQFLEFWNDNVLYFAKRTADLSSYILVMVSLDPHNPQGGHFEVPLWELGLPDTGTVKVEDLVADRQFVWAGKVQHWWFEPENVPYAVFRISV
ncbi:alpha-1,4-glucan--maltose-1-phosphate maltosyltransferase [Aureimonas pseudogalii]|uniref:Alpha-1,4-glucan:maltose-1-phosphate maltosyltransferase n=1 Tax=Aureimonas pseudogalii TaxID=1744844 RepID=A0A7W6EG77_9HYPH|nr:alpha-1,4-glucan--maltose-1-phosphate maltosyltransferase [Aureimonas pseudogalii]MBB3997349.1 starch synthase (maltosyl-transferring) [Aureimonas pseudogalii]